MLHRLKRHFSKIDRAIERFVYWVGFFLLLWSAMSWIAAYIPNIAQFGWAAVVFTGLGIACVVSLVISVGLIAWRYFSPMESGETVVSSDDLHSKRIDWEEKVIYVARIFVNVSQIEANHYVSIGAACVNLSNSELILGRILGTISLAYGSRMFALRPPPHIDAQNLSERTVAPRSEFTISLIQIIPGEHVSPLVEALNSGWVVEFDFNNLQLELSDSSGETLTAHLWEKISVQFTSVLPHVMRIVTGAGAARITSERRHEI